MNLSNEQTFEFGQARLRTRDGLRFTMRESGNGVWYLVEDEISGRFFQIGLPQYTFLSMLDGRRTVNQVLMKTSTLLRQHAIDEDDAAGVCKWAIEAGLVETELSSTSARHAERSEQETIQKSIQWLNPVTLKIPLVNPDGLFTIMNRYIGWLVSWGGLILWTIVVAFGFLQLARHWDVFISNRVESFGRNDLMWLGLTWMVLKFFHESAHSLVCKRFGGRLHSCGVLLLLLIPLPYVDVTSIWRFENKWHRVLTAAAGMMMEIFIAAIACCVWVAADPGPIQYHAGNVIIAATLHTLLFNANPLMRFDGYYMLSDGLEIPNLYTHGRQYVKGVFKKIYFGAELKPLHEVGMRALFVKVYGFLTILWFFVIAVGLLLGAASLFEGIGLVIAALALLIWVGIPLFKLLKQLIVGSKTEKPARGRFAVAMAITVALLGGFLWLCPSPSVVSAPVVFDYEPLSVVRARAPGFANTVHVVNGQHVKKGQLLVTLHNPELVEELQSLDIDIRISQLRCDSLLDEGDIAGLKLEKERLAGMQNQYDELKRLVGYLEVRAPQAGKVLAREMANIEGTWFEPGSEFLSIGGDQKKEAIALARQEDVDWIEASGRSHVEICVWGRNEDNWIEGDISRINPRARDDLPHQAFAASNGGPLAVVSRDQVESTEGEDEEDSLMLIYPRVPLRIEIPTDKQSELWAGQGGLMMIRSRQQNMGNYLAHNLIRFIRRNSIRSHGL